MPPRADDYSEVLAELKHLREKVDQISLTVHGADGHSGIADVVWKLLAKETTRTRVEWIVITCVIVAVVAVVVKTLAKGLV